MADHKWGEILKEHVLCYIEGDKAIFTNSPLSEQWGDDWNDEPYEHNAGRPYTWREGESRPRYSHVWVKFEVEMNTPAAIVNGDSRYSVEDINKKYIAWLTPSEYNDTPTLEPIFAGVTVAEFKRLIWLNGGEIYEATPHEEGY